MAHNHMQEQVNANSPVEFTGMDSWNTLSSHIVYAINGTGNGFTGDVWTANTRKKQWIRGHFFSIWTATELTSVLELDERYT